MNVLTFVLDLELKIEDDIRDDDPINIGMLIFTIWVDVLFWWYDIRQSCTFFAIERFYETGPNFKSRAELST